MMENFQLKIGSLVETKVPKEKEDEFWVDALVIGKNENFIDLLILESEKLNLLPLAYQVNLNEIRINKRKALKIAIEYNEIQKNTEKQTEKEEENDQGEEEEDSSVDLLPNSKEMHKQMRKELQKKEDEEAEPISVLVYGSNCKYTNGTYILSKVDETTTEFVNTSNENMKLSTTVDPEIEMYMWEFLHFYQGEEYSWFMGFCDTGTYSRYMPPTDADWMAGADENATAPKLRIMGSPRLWKKLESKAKKGQKKVEEEVKEEEEVKLEVEEEIVERSYTLKLGDNVIHGMSKVCGTICKCEENGEKEEDIIVLTNMGLIRDRENRFYLAVQHKNEGKYWKKMIHQKHGLVFYYNVLTEKIEWMKPDDFEEIGDYLVTDEEIEALMETHDDYILGKHVTTSGMDFDQSSTTLSIDAHFNKDDRIEVKLNKRFYRSGVEVDSVNPWPQDKGKYTEDDYDKYDTIEESPDCEHLNRTYDYKNHTVVTESVHNGCIDLGSGALIRPGAILTAAHCVTHKDNGIVEIVPRMRIRMPNIKYYNTEPNNARLGKKDKRFKNFIKYATDIIVYPNYFQEGNANTGDDLALIKLTDEEIQKLKKHHANFLGIRIFSYEGLRGLEVLGFPADNFNKKYQLYSSEVTAESLGADPHESIKNFDWKKFVLLKMHGNEGVLHYINQTSGGQSGGPVIGHFGGCHQVLVGTHVAGFLYSSKGTAITKTNHAWILSHLRKDRGEVTDTKSVPDRVCEFLDTYEKRVTNDGRVFTIEQTDMQILPIMLRMMSHLDLPSNFEQLKIGLGFENLDDESIQMRWKKDFLDNLNRTKIPGLTKLSFFENNFSSNLQDFEAFREVLQNRPMIIDLDLSNCRLDGKKMKKNIFVILLGTNLQNLNLQFNKEFGDQGLKNLFEYLPNSNLQTLNLNSTGMTNEGLIWLTEILPRTKLKELHFRFMDTWKGMNDEGLQALCVALPKTEIHTLSLPSGRRVITEVGVNSFCQILPQLKLTNLYFGVRKNLLSLVLDTIPQTSITNYPFEITPQEFPLLPTILPQLNSITHLDLQKNKKDMYLHDAKNWKVLYQNDAVFQNLMTSIPNSKAISYLNMNEVELTSDQIALVGSILPETNITHLFLDRATISKTFIDEEESIKFCHCLAKSKVIVFSMYGKGTGLEDSGIKELASILPQIKNLIGLRVGNAEVTEESLKFLLEALKDNKMEHVQLVDCKISEEFETYYKDLPELQHIHISWVNSSRANGALRRFFAKSHKPQNSIPEFHY